MRLVVAVTAAAVVVVVVVVVDDHCNCFPHLQKRRNSNQSCVVIHSRALTPIINFHLKLLQEVMPMMKMRPKAMCNNMDTMTKMMVMMRVGCKKLIRIDSS
jgi:sensor domain CHASE-containing protein